MQVATGFCICINPGETSGELLPQPGHGTIEPNLQVEIIDPRVREHPSHKNTGICICQASPHKQNWWDACVCICVPIHVCA